MRVIKYFVRIDREAQLIILWDESKRAAVVTIGAMIEGVAATVTAKSLASKNAERIQSAQ